MRYDGIYCLTVVVYAHAMVECFFGELLLCIRHHLLYELCAWEGHFVHRHQLWCFIVFLAVEEDGWVAGNGSPAVGGYRV